MIDKLIVASYNNHKVLEIAQILKDFCKVSSLKDVGYSLEIIENGNSFAENSYIKAMQVYRELGIPVLADDSGLCVNALRGDPGIFSARYGGDQLDDTGRYQLLLTNMTGITDRSASFVCNMTLITSLYTFVSVQGECAGTISDKPSGLNGFGYDPVFFLEKYNKTMAELSSDIKNQISHRAMALKGIIKFLG